MSPVYGPSRGCVWGGITFWAKMSPRGVLPCGVLAGTRPCHSPRTSPPTTRHVPNASRTRVFIPLQTWPSKAMLLCFFTTLAVAGHAFVVVPSAHAQPLATRRVAPLPLPRAGHVVAKSTYTHKSTYTQWDVLFNREKVHQVCVLPTLTCTNAAWPVRPALPPSHIPLQSDLIKTSSFTPPPAKRSASVLRLCPAD